MNEQTGKKLLHKLLLEGASGRRLWTSLLAMAAGLALLFAAVLIWWNFNELLQGRASGDSLGSSFLTLSRKVTNENMGHPELTVFSKKDIEEIRHAPEVEDLGVVAALHPRAYMSMQMAPGAAFSTIMILEAVPDRFMDHRPDGWGWQAGNTNVPIILSASFLSLYNYAFAPSQGLPQLSEETIKALPFRLEVGDDGHSVAYTAHVAGFSDRITSVLVPESFLRNANGVMNDTTTASRLIVKVNDPSSTKFSKFLESHGYVTNSEMMRWSKLRAIVQTVAGITGGLAILLLGVSLLVFVLFIELTIARASHSVQLLQEIGYSRNRLQSFLTGSFLPLLGIAVGISLAVAVVAQVCVHFMGMNAGLTLPLLPGWPMWLCLMIVCGLLYFQMKHAIGMALKRG